MKSIGSYIYESQEVKDLQNRIKNLGKEKIFDGNYDLDNVNPKFKDILISLNSTKSKDSTLISTWRMLFSKLIVEPLVVKFLGDNDCEMSTIRKDRIEKWDICYKKNIYIDVKATYNSRTHNFSLDNSTCDFIKTNEDNKERYICFFYPEIRNWNQSVELYRNKDYVKLYFISFDDLKNVLDDNKIISKSFGKLIPYSYIEENSDKFIDMKTFKDKI